MDDKPLGTFMPGDVAAKRFDREIDPVPAGDARGIRDAACREALPLLTAFRTGGTARTVADALTARV
jgi:hypothetical protein